MSSASLISYEDEVRTTAIKFRGWLIVLTIRVSWLCHVADACASVAQHCVIAAIHLVLTLSIINKPLQPWHFMQCNVFALFMFERKDYTNNTQLAVVWGEMVSALPTAQGPNFTSPVRSSHQTSILSVSDYSYLPTILDSLLLVHRCIMTDLPRGPQRLHNA